VFGETSFDTRYHCIGNKVEKPRGWCNSRCVGREKEASELDIALCLVIPSRSCTWCNISGLVPLVVSSRLCRPDSSSISRISADCND
jgi:hypothetical protein